MKKRIFFLKFQINIRYFKFFNNLCYISGCLLSRFGLSLYLSWHIYTRKYLYNQHAADSDFFDKSVNHLPSGMVNLRESPCCFCLFNVIFRKIYVLLLPLTIIFLDWKSLLTSYPSVNVTKIILKNDHWTPNLFRTIQPLLICIFP